METPPVTQYDAVWSENDFVLVIHGGASTAGLEEYTAEKCTLYRAALNQALKSGYQVLRAGGEAMDAAVAAVSVMEDCPLFNAGKGSVFNVAGKNELEASIMLSKPPSTYPSIPATRRGTSLTLLTCTRNPSQLARALYLAPELVPHPMLHGATAEAIGSQHLGIPTVDPSYFWTEDRWKEHRRDLGLPDEPVGPNFVQGKGVESAIGAAPSGTGIDLLPKGTVGAVALDVRGCISTVTSTGGRTNKLVGRIGDTPTMGSGFWAAEWTRKRATFADPLGGGTDIHSVGVSGTGDGDFFIRHNAAATIARRMEYLDESVDSATQKVVEDLFEEGGSGGAIALAGRGTVMSLRLNCVAMNRGVIRSDGVPLTAVLAEEDLSEFLEHPIP